MPTIITEKFRQSNATAFSNDISTSKYYMFLGKSQTWESEGSSSDTQPPAPIDSVAPESYYWDDMLASKLISSKSFVVPRRDWSSTSTFDMYRHDISSSATSSSGSTNLYDSSFYFKTSAHNVYKVSLMETMHKLVLVQSVEQNQTVQGLHHFFMNKLDTS